VFENAARDGSGKNRTKMKCGSMQNSSASDCRSDADLIMTPLRPGKHITKISSSKLCARLEADLRAEMMKKAPYITSIKRNTCPVFIFFRPFCRRKIRSSPYFQGQSRRRDDARRDPDGRLGYVQLHGQEKEVTEPFISRQLSSSPSS